MTLSEQQVLELSKITEPTEEIKMAREESEYLRMHYYGENLAKYLTKVEELENDKQAHNRQKYAISNTARINSLLQPVQNIWSAKGQSFVFHGSEKQEEVFRPYKNQIKQGVSLISYFKTQWFDRFITDPHGLLYWEVSKDDPLNVYPTYKDIHSILKMPVDGIVPRYIVFEPDLELDGDGSTGQSPLKNDSYTDNKRRFKWVVDDAYYYRVMTAQGQSSIEDKIPNTFGVVPAFQNSPILDTRRMIKISPINNELDLLKSYLIDNSINNIYKKIHGFAKFWFYSQPCQSCKGTGEITMDNGDSQTCTNCNGSGYAAKFDVSDGLPLMPPQSNEDPVIAPNPMGYVQPALETMQEQRTELIHIAQLIEYSHWNTTQEKASDGQKETATGRFIDAQSVTNKLHQYTDVVENILNKSINLVLKHILPNSKVEATYILGRRYLVESADKLWETYLSSKGKGADYSTLDYQLEQYYEAEFKTNETMFIYQTKLMKVEPLVHDSLKDVLSMEVPETIKNQKLYFPEWKNITPIGEVVNEDNTVEKLKIKLYEYTNKKTVLVKD